MKNPVYIFGESDIEKDRQGIEQQITHLHEEGKIQYLLSEECASTYDEKHPLPGCSTQKLGINLGIPVARFSQGFHTSGYINDMITRYALKGGTAVILNNRHLLTQGCVSPVVKRFLCNKNVVFHSHHLDHAIIDVHGIAFNEDVYRQLFVLSTALSKEKPVRYPFFDMGEFLGDNVHTYLYFNDNKILAFLTFTVNKPLHRVTINRFYTREAYRHNGYGKALLRQLEQCYPHDKYRVIPG